MALTLRPLNEADIEFMEAYRRGEVEKPRWLTDWEERIEEAQRALGVALRQGQLTQNEAQVHMHAIAKMMHRRERLFVVWMEGVPFKTWNDLASEFSPTAEDLLSFTVEDTEDFLNGPGVLAFVLFLEDRHPGLLKEFTQQCLRECDPLLAEGLELTPEVCRHLFRPQEAFGTKNPEVLETRLAEWVRAQNPLEMPSHSQRLLVANALAASGKYPAACQEAEFARCEAAEPYFELLMQQQDQRANELLLQSERWQIDVLLSMWPTGEQ